MKMPAVTSSTDLWVRVVVYLIARLTRNRLTRLLVELIQPALDSLEETAAAMKVAERAMIIARAQYDGADEELDEIVARFEGELLLHVGKNRKSPLYRKFFPKGLVAVTGAKVSDEVRLVKTIEAAIPRELPGVEFAIRLLPQITTAREEMETQMAAFQVSLDASATAWAGELGARHDLRRQYRIVFAELIKIFPESMKKVNSFFKDVKSARRSSGSTEDTEELNVTDVTSATSPVAGDEGEGTGEG